MNRRESMMDAASPEPDSYEPTPDDAPAPAEVGADPYEKLKEAKQLLDDGILTEEEFAAEKKKILGT
ncbi:MAG: SHOCT domain-containing protein [Acidimicrobiia bacterium]